MSVFTPNYPATPSGTYHMRSVPERMASDPRYTGRGVVMAFIDSGFYPHPDLTDRVLVHADATSARIVEGRRFNSPELYAWHGQMTTVVAAGDGRTSHGRYCGIACDSQLVLIKVSTRAYQIKEADILRGMRWLLANHRRFNVRVCNVSVGGDFLSNDPHHPLHEAVAQLIAEGITVMVAAGNSGQELLVPPASAPDAITVGGVDDRNADDRALWRPYRNNYARAYDGGYKPEVTALASWIPSPILPGTWVDREAKWLAAFLELETEDAINALILRCYAEIGIAPNAARHPTAATYKIIQNKIIKHKIIDPHHQHVDGTSVSVAIASSVVAQLIEANPYLMPAAIKDILISTADPLPDVSFEQQGAGMINSQRALSAALDWGK